MPQKRKRIGMALFGVIVTGFCVGAFQKADLGAGTVVTALFMGPVIQWFNTNFSEPFLYGSRP